MEAKTVQELLQGNRYPGRGIILGRSADNTKAVLAYFIMGRSVNSRNRIFVKTDDGIRTTAFDPAKMVDPSLIIYHPVRIVSVDGSIVTIVANGDQSDTIRDSLLSSEGYFPALMKRKFEPDAPNYTPRISGILFPCGDYMLSILKSFEGNPDCCVRNIFTYDNPKPGTGHLIHTYQQDGDPLPSFEGEPKLVRVEGDIDAFTADVWKNLNEDHKVSLYVRFTDIATGQAEERIVNKNM